VTDDHLSDHLSTDDLAELDEDLLEPGRAASARTHLAGCPTCQARLAEIKDVREQLRDLPRPEMPAQVNARIDRALADVSAPKDSTVVPIAEAPSRRRFGRPSAAAAAAAAAVVLLVGAIVVALVHNNSGSNGSNEAGSNSTETTTSGLAPASEQPKDYHLSASGDTYTATSLQRLVPALVTTATRAPSDTPAFGASNSGRAPAASPTTTHGSAQLGSQGSAGTSNATGATSNRVVPGLSSTLKSHYGNRSWLLSCARYLTDTTTAVPIAIDFGKWSDATHTGVPSIVFVFRDTNPNAVDVYVSGPTCRGIHAIRTYQKVGVTP
jgi:anti-sigma factor RsiW